MGNETVKASLGGALICPVCGAPLGREGNSYICAGTGGKRHCFDCASTGYVNLGFVHGHGAMSGDPPEAVRARTAFLDRGYYKPAADMIKRIADEYSPAGIFADAGCGEGYYSVQLASDERFVFGADLSKYAVERAAKRAAAEGKRGKCLFAVASVYELPLADGSARGLLCMFSPCAEAEYTRVLERGGILIVGSAGPRHLYGLKAAVYDTPTLNEPRADLPSGMELLACERLTYNMSFTPDRRGDISALFGMTPYKYRTSAEDSQRLGALECLECEADFEFRVYRKN